LPLYTAVIFGAELLLQLPATLACVKPPEELGMATSAWETGRDGNDSAYAGHSLLFRLFALKATSSSHSSSSSSPGACLHFPNTFACDPIPPYLCRKLWCYDEEARELLTRRINVAQLGAFSALDPELVLNYSRLAFASSGVLSEQQCEALCQHRQQVPYYDQHLQYHAYQSTYRDARSFILFVASLGVLVGRVWIDVMLCKNWLRDLIDTNIKRPSRGASPCDRIIVKLARLAVGLSPFGDDDDDRCGNDVNNSRSCGSSSGAISSNSSSNIIDVNSRAKSTTAKKFKDKLREKRLKKDCCCIRTFWIRGVLHGRWEDLERRIDQILRLASGIQRNHHHHHHHHRKRTAEPSQAEPVIGRK
jgi:hypothetical protein